jgi:hypothetical protein
MSVGWGHSVFLVWFFGSLVGTASYIVLLTILHYGRPRVFDKKFLKKPHFTDIEILYAITGGIMNVLLTKLVCLIILFPNRRQYQWRKLGNVGEGVPTWFRWMAALYYINLVVALLIVVGILVGFEVYERSVNWM